MNNIASIRHGTQRVRANAVYNEYIQDKHHIHMNSTRWVTLSEFIKYMGREGLVRVDENEKGFWVSWVDTSPKALARQAEMQKREKADEDDEQRQRKQLKEQIERARLQAEALKEKMGGDVEKGLQRQEGEKVSLSIGLPNAKEEEKDDPVDAGTSTHGSEASPSLNTTTSTAEATTSAPAIPTPAAKITINPLKRPAPTNIFKSSSKAPKTAKTGTAREADNKVHLASKQFLTAAEKLMLEDQERMKRKSGGGGYQGMGPSRGGR